MTPLEAETKALAASFEGERETDGPNNSPQIRRWQAHCNQKPPASYCACAVCCIVYDAGLRVPVPPRLKRSASALRLLDLNPDLVIDRATAVALMRAGHPVVFVIDTKPVGDGKGHCGFGVGISADGETFESLEGNTGPGPAAPAQDRDGQGFYRRHDRRLDSVKGWMRIA